MNEAETLAYAARYLNARAFFEEESYDEVFRNSRLLDDVLGPIATEREGESLHREYGVNYEDALEDVRDDVCDIAEHQMIKWCLAMRGQIQRNHPAPQYDSLLIEIKDCEFSHRYSQMRKLRFEVVPRMRASLAKELGDWYGEINP